MMADKDLKTLIWGEFLTLLNNRIDVLSIMNDPIKSKVCDCGRKGGDLSCITNACKCLKYKVPCWEKPSCNCLKCGNPYGSRFTKRSKEKPCRCKTGCDETTRCICWKIGASCSEKPR